MMRRRGLLLSIASKSDESSGLEFPLYLTTTDGVREADDVSVALAEWWRTNYVEAGMTYYIPEELLGANLIYINNWLVFWMETTDPEAYVDMYTEENRVYRLEISPDRGRITMG